MGGAACVYSAPMGQHGSPSRHRAGPSQRQAARPAPATAVFVGADERRFRKWQNQRDRCYLPSPAAIAQKSLTGGPYSRLAAPGSPTRLSGPESVWGDPAARYSGVSFKRAREVGRTPPPARGFSAAPHQLGPPPDGRATRWSEGGSGEAAPLARPMTWTRRGSWSR